MCDYPIHASQAGRYLRSALWIKIHPNRPWLFWPNTSRILSFENPNAPQIYQALGQSGPEIKFDIDIVPAPLDQRVFEIVLALRVSATIDENTAFLIELDYAGVVRIGATVPEDAMESLLFSEAPRHLYPFARSILAKVTGDAAFPPLFVNPIDFEGYYRTTKMGALAAVMGKPEEGG